MISNLIKQGSHYISGSLLISIAGIISFPIFTRLLPVEQYGILSLITTLIGLMVAFQKLGLQQSILRYYSRSLENFRSIVFSIFIINILIIFLIYLLVFSIVEFFYPGYIPSHFIIPLYLSSALQSYRLIVMSYFAADQKTKTVNIVNVSQRYLSIILMILSILYFEKEAANILYAILISEIIFVLAISIYRKHRIKTIVYKSPLTKKILIYSFPLMIVEILQIAHAFIDRFLINYYLDAEAVAYYSAPYSIADIISSVLLGSIATALIPIYMRLWNDNKKEQVEELLTTVSDYFLLFFPIVIVGGYLVSEPLMYLLASDKYVESAHILPIALAGIAIFSSTFIYSAGLRLKSSQKITMLYVFESLLLNIFLNILLIEIYGIYGSAFSTVASYLWMSIRFYFKSMDVLKIEFNFFQILKGGAVSVVMYTASILLVEDIEGYLGLIYQVLVAGSVSLIFVVFIDKRIRSKVIDIVS